jgi:hypothetical protein
MSKPLLLLLPLLWQLMACDDAPPQRPADLLDRELFTELLLEAQLIEARINHELVVEHVSDVPGQRYYEELFSSKGVTREQFERTFAWYSEQPEELKAIYEEIVDELVRRKDRVRQ